MGHWPNGTRQIAAVVAVALVAVGCTSGGGGGGGATDDQDTASDQTALAVEVVSSRPEYVSGGNALVAVTLEDGAGDPGDVTITAGDQDVTDGFAADPDDERRLVGLVDELAEGDTTIAAAVGDESAELTVTNYPLSGPMFSGEHLELAACTTEVYGLAPSTLDQDCAAPTEVTWRYVDSAGTTKDLPDPAAVPADAEMVDVDGTSVPFVLRDETGVINRSIYKITVFEPHPNGTDPTSVDTSAWNERLVYRFGGGCGAAFTQGFSWVGDPPLELLRRGYAAATATFNTFQVMCNDVLSAETVSMVKEHFVEAYGEPVHTIGEGGSGGAIQQFQIAQNYPGLLDAIAPSLVFPDAYTISPGIFDCALLTNYYGTPAGSQLTTEQRVALNGHGVANTCELWDLSFAGNIDPIAGCEFNIGSAFGGGGEAPLPGVPADQVYDPVSNPDGFRCTAWDSNVHVVGQDPETGHARSGFDNAGVQYGLDAVNAGTITVDQFLDLNGAIGGYDSDGQPQPERSEVPEELIGRAYETGRVTGPRGGLPDTPVLMVSPYTDMIGDIHDRVRVFTVLDRFADEDGTRPATISVWSSGIGAAAGVAALSGALGDAAIEPVAVLDEWLTAAREHHEAEGGEWRDALVDAKPASAESRCVVEGQEPVVGPESIESDACSSAYPLHEEPRMAAGGPRSADIIKCQLIPVDEATDLYEVDFSDEQLDRLATIFPDGVCDYTQPSQGDTEVTETWINYLD